MKPGLWTTLLPVTVCCTVTGCSNGLLARHRSSKQAAAHHDKLLGLFLWQTSHGMLLCLALNLVDIVVLLLPTAAVNLA